MNKNCFPLIVGLSSLISLSCLTDLNNNYTYNTYKAIINNQNIENIGITNVYLPIPDSNVLKNIDAYNIYTYQSFLKIYGDYKDSLGIDSSFFNKYWILSFILYNIRADEAIDRYTFKIISDTLKLDCRIRQENSKYLEWSFGPNVNVITFKVNK